MMKLSQMGLACAMSMSVAFAGEAVVAKVKVNPLIMGLQPSYLKAKIPSVRDGAEYLLTGEIREGALYSCVRYPALALADPMNGLVPRAIRLDYRFAGVDKNWLENLNSGGLESSRIRFYYPRPELRGELTGSLWGDRTVLESIRVDSVGGLMIETYAKSDAWVDAVVKWFRPALPELDHPSVEKSFRKDVIRLAKEGVTTGGYLMLYMTSCEAP